MVRGGLGEVLDDLGTILQRTWSGLGEILGRLGRNLAVLGRSGGGLGQTWVAFGMVLDPRRTPRGPTMGPKNEPACTKKILDQVDVNANMIHLRNCE